MKSIYKNKTLTWCLSIAGAAGLLAVPFFMGQPTVKAAIDGRGMYDPADEDADGMSDTWEIYYFGSTEARDGSEDDDLDDILNVDEWNSGTDPLHLDPRSVGESGFVEVSQVEGRLWHTVRLDGSYSNPVVIMGPASFYGGQPMTIRVKNVKTNSFEFQFAEYAYQDGWHTTERLSWIVMEEGVHVLPNGQKLQAGYTSVGRRGGRVDFSEVFETVPVVMSQVTTYNGSLSTTPAQWNVSGSGFDVILRNQEDNVRHNKSESTAWIAIEKGQGLGAAGAFEIGETGRSVDHRWKSLSFGGTLSHGPTFFAMMQSRFGKDTANIRYRNLSNTGVEVRVHEEQSEDKEMIHTTENVGYLVASPGMFHVLSTTGDTDADGIADSYELANGLVIGELDFYGDEDGDGLSNAEEARYGTRADLADTDGDLVSDFDEINFFKSSALASDVGTFQLEQTIAGADYVNPFGTWEVENAKVHQASVRGSVEYTITAESPGIHAVEVDLAPYSGANRSKYYEVVISVDGEFVSRESLEMTEGQTGTAKVLTPWLAPGNHSVCVFIDNSYTFRKAEIQQIRLFSATGTDSNGNTVADWAEIRTENQNGLVRSFAVSKTSPVCLEGKGRFISLIQSSLALDIHKAPNDMWYADLDLDANTPTDLQLTYENGAVVEEESVEWVATNLLQESNFTIRQGDALRLTASNSNEGTSLEDVSLTVEGYLFTTTADQPLVHRFDNAGVQIIDVIHIDESGAQTNHEVSVNVIARVAVSSPVCVVGYERQWEITELPAEAIVQIGDQVSVFDGQRLGANGYSYTIATHTPESKYAVVRLGYSGPVLGSTEIKAMTVRSADKTSVTYGEDMGDGTYLLNMPVIVSQAYVGVIIRCDIYLAGVIYPDGTQSTEIEAVDFGEFGSHTLEFIKAPNVDSNCHRFSVWQDGIRIAYYN